MFQSRDCLKMIKIERNLKTEIFEKLKIFELSELSQFEIRVNVEEIIVL